jgi:hypothetical protein
MGLEPREVSLPFFRRCIYKESGMKKNVVLIVKVKKVLQGWYAFQGAQQRLIILECEKTFDSELVKIID